MIYLIAFIVLVICCAIAEHSSNMEDSAKKQNLEAEKQARAAERQAQHMQRLAEIENEAKLREFESRERVSAIEASARRPDAFIRLFSEEFPGYANDITYGKSEQILAIFSELWASDLVREKLNAAGGNEEALLSDTFLQVWIGGKLAGLVSTEYVEYAESFPEEFLRGLVRCVKSSATIAGA